MIIIKYTHGLRRVQRFLRTRTTLWTRNFTTVTVDPSTHKLYRNNCRTCSRAITTSIIRAFIFFGYERSFPADLRIWQHRLGGICLAQHDKNGEWSHGHHRTFGSRFYQKKFVERAVLGADPSSAIINAQQRIQWGKRGLFELSDSPQQRLRRFRFWIDE